MLTGSDRLRDAIGERYSVTGLLGAGGMASVYRATDRKHQREVAIKVLRPDLSQALGADRFLQEIEIAARLQHPRILPLYDSGSADGLLYYVMPLVEGETLRDRLAREKQLPVDEAVRIAREVASALAYAHARGIVHRDIKPENILLSAGESMVADFGIARALREAGGTRLTMTGVSVGTPAYMSPEQAAGDPDVDARSDVYSLGCVLYEMLAGLPPFTGPTVESVVRQHLAAPVPQITLLRPTVPAELARTVERALAKIPADRMSSAAELGATLSGSLTTVSAPARAARPMRMPRGWARLAIAALVVAAVGVGGALLLRRAASPPVDASLIAVLPFRVSGDSSVAFLREGMVDLLTTQLGALNESRTLDARTVLAAWRRAVPEGEDPSTRDARALAASLGSGRLVLGSIVGTSAGLSMAASLVTVGGGAQIDAAVQGSRDSLFGLVDQLTSQLIAGSIREPAHRIANLTSGSLPAVRAYLDARAALRSGAIERARARFTEALELDSTFALAALGMASSGVWSQQAGQSAALRRGLLTGYALRERLPRRDQLLFEAWVLPNTSSTLTARDQLLAWQRAVEAAPESPEALYEYADRLYHSGEQLGIADARVRAESLFARALALDSTLAGPLAHLVELAARSGDRTTTRRLAAHYTATPADAGDYVRWRVALVLGDRRTLDSLRARPSTSAQFSLNRIIGFGLTDGVALADVDAAAVELQRRVDAGTDTPGNVHPGQTLHAWAMNRGRRAEAARAIAVMRARPRPVGSSIVFLDADQVPVLDALFWDGDSAAAAAAAERIDARIARAHPQGSSERSGFYTDACVAAHWHHAQRNEGTVNALVAQLRAGATQADSAGLHGADPTLCLTMLEALAASAGGHSTAGALVVRLDSILSTGPYVFGSDWGNLVLARLLEARGDHEGALRALARRPYDWDTGPLYLSTYLRETGRLAALLGRRVQALEAYDRFLTLRSGADAVYRAQREAIAAAAAVLR